MFETVTVGSCFVWKFQWGGGMAPWPPQRLHLCLCIKPKMEKGVN